MPSVLPFSSLSTRVFSVFRLSLTPSLLSCLLSSLFFLFIIVFLLSPLLLFCITACLPSFLSRLFIIMSSDYPSYIFIISCLLSTPLHLPYHHDSSLYPSYILPIILCLHSSPPFFLLHQFLNLSELIMQLDHANVSELCLLRRYHASTLVLLI